MNARKKSKLVQGVGINDADYAISVRNNVNGKSTELWACPFYYAWKAMLRRCYSAKYHAKFPTYIGCSVSPEWRSFSVFRAWMVAQEWRGNQLDKDILMPGNKVYGPDNCVFVPGKLNNFITDNSAKRGKLPIGVYFQKEEGKMVAQCKNPFTEKSEYLGSFDDPMHAHVAWRKRKHELACIYADKQTDQRIAEALRARYA